MILIIFFNIGHSTIFYVLGASMTEKLNSRLFLGWAYDIAKGMEHLSKNAIMHGDLAARNILISRQHCNNESGLVAKVADFGLAKNFSNNTTYTKTHRKYLPWKWMVKLLSCISIGNI